MMIRFRVCFPSCAKYPQMENCRSPYDHFPTVHLARYLKIKNDGLRTIACGPTHRRLSTKVALNTHRSLLASTFLPHQVGVGVRGGGEAIVHAARSFMVQKTPTRKAVIKGDFRNAFNSVHRNWILNEIKKISSDLYRMAFHAYRNSTSLLFGAEIIESSRGVQKGDPASPAFFCLALQPLVDSLKSEFIVWYLDDGILGGQLETVETDLKKIRDFRFTPAWS